MVGLAIAFIIGAAVGFVFAVVALAIVAQNRTSEEDEKRGLDALNS